MTCQICHEPLISDDFKLDHVRTIEDGMVVHDRCDSDVDWQTKQINKDARLEKV